VALNIEIDWIQFAEVGPLGEVNIRLNIGDVELLGSPAIDPIWFPLDPIEFAYYGMCALRAAKLFGTAVFSALESEFYLFFLSAGDRISVFCDVSQKAVACSYSELLDHWTALDARLRQMIAQAFPDFARAADGAQRAWREAWLGGTANPADEMQQFARPLPEPIERRLRVPDVIEQGQDHVHGG